MSTPFMGEVKIVSFNFAPQGWALCNGGLLPINQNQALFSLLGTTYGGNGQTTFALPNLQGRTPLHFGGGFTQGQAAGETSAQGRKPDGFEYAVDARGFGRLAVINGTIISFLAAMTYG